MIDPSDAGTFRAVIVEPTMQSPLAVTLVRRNGDVSPDEGGTTIWSHTFDTAEEAEHCCQWMRSQPERWAYWGRLASVLGPVYVTAIVSKGVAEEAIRRRKEEAAAREAAEQDARLSLVIESYLVERRGRFGVNLKRANEREAFWDILFRERWERERFRDWWNCQRDRFQEFADYLEDHSAIELERVVLQEMMETERQVKKAGLSAGGRRPLRFWRGEL